MLQIQMTLFPENGGVPTMPLVVVADSGRASNWIARYCELSDQERKQRYIAKEGRALLKKDITKFYPTKANEIVDILERVATQRRNFVSYIIMYRFINSTQNYIVNIAIQLLLHKRDNSGS